MNKIKWIYYLSTGLLSLIMLFSVGMYFFNHETVSEMFTSLAYPTYIIYPLAIAKILGLIAIWTKKSRILFEWAYAGFFFDVLLALVAHIMVNDGQHMIAAAAFVFLIISYFSEKKLNASA